MEMAKGLLQVLEDRLEGTTLSDLLSSQIYIKYGRLPSALGSSPSPSHSCTSDPQEESHAQAPFSKGDDAESSTAKAEDLTAEIEAAATGQIAPPVAQTDTQLFKQLVVSEGMTLPPEVELTVSGESEAWRGWLGLQSLSASLCTCEALSFNPCLEKNPVSLGGATFFGSLSFPLL